MGKEGTWAWGTQKGLQLGTWSPLLFHYSPARLPLPAHPDWLRPPWSLWRPHKPISWPPTSKFLLVTSLVLTLGRATEIPTPGFGPNHGEALPWLVTLK